MRGEKRKACRSEERRGERSMRSRADESGGGGGGGELCKMRI